MKGAIMAITLTPSDILAFNNDLDEHVVEILIKDGLALSLIHI